MAQLGTAGFSWKAYEEGVSIAGYNVWSTASTGNYASSLVLSRHCPAAFYTTTSSAGVGHGNGRYDFDELATDIANSTLPDFFFITPNGVHDGHDNGVSAANTWLTSGGSWGGINNLIAGCGRVACSRSPSTTSPLPTRPSRSPAAASSTSSSPGRASPTPSTRRRAPTSRC
jgi:hypothetical protein